MKIILTTPYDLDVPGGVNNQLWLLYQQLRQQDGTEVRVLAPSTQPARWQQPDVIPMGRVTTVRLNGSTARLCLDITLGSRIRQLLETFQPDIIHLQEPLYPLLNYLVLHYSRAVNVGTFHTYARHHWPYYLTRPWLRRLARRLHLRLAVSALARDYVAQHVPGSYEILPNSIAVPEQPPCRPGTPGKKTLLFVGRLSDPRKSFQDLWLAYARLEQRTPGRYRLLVVGPGQEVWQQRQTPGDVHWLGVLSDEALQRLYATCDVLCAPSVDGESFGIVVLEAFARAIPVVVGDIAGYRALVEHGRNGFCVPPHDDAALALTLERLLGDGHLQAQMQQAAFETARRYDVSQTFPVLWAHYQRLHAQHQGEHVFQEVDHADEGIAR